MSLQGLRALAYMLIFIFHTNLYNLNGLGAMGVSIFIVLSGFVLAYSNNKKQEEKIEVKNAVKFSFKKISKLYLLHIFTLLVCILLSIIKNQNKNILVFISKIFCNLFLIQSWIPIKSFNYSFNGVSWYLSVSLFLYFIFPYIKRYMKKRCNSIKSILSHLFFVFFLEFIIVFLLYSLNKNNYISANFVKWFVYIFPIFRSLDFICGCLLGHLISNYKINLNKYLVNTAEIAIIGLIYIYIYI